jgi:preprotein translocase subunit SecA
MMERLGLKHGEVIESPMVTRGIERAQKKVEARNFDIRKSLLEYDEVMDKQRKFIYGQRQEVLEGIGYREKITGMFEELLEPVVETHAGDKEVRVAHEEIRTWVQHKVGNEIDFEGFDSIPRDEIFEWILERFEAALGRRAEHYGEADWARVQQFLLLDAIDQKWKDHLHAMEVLKAGIGLRGYAQVDPKNEYKKEGFEKFKLLKESIAEQVTNLIFRVELTRAEMQPPPTARAPRQVAPDPVTAQAMIDAMIAAGQAPPEVMEAVAKGAKVTVAPRAEVERRRQAEAARQADAARQEKHDEKQAAVSRHEPGSPRPGRNDPCPCGSGVKYKKCCHPAFG